MKSDKRLMNRRVRRGFRVRNRVRRDAHGRMRLSVFRSNRHMYAQVIDDAAGHTVVAASTMEDELAGPGKVAADRESASRVGELIARRAQEKGISEVVLDRGAFRYHGRVAALANAARDAGLRF